MPSGPPPPPESFPQGAQAPYGHPPYGSEPSYSPGPQQYGQQPGPAYGAGGYQAGQGQYPPQGGYAPSYAAGQYPAAPQGGGAGGKIAAIVAVAVVVVSLVVGGVFLLTRDGGDPVADRTSTSPRRDTPDPTTPDRKSTPTHGALDDDAAMALAEAAFPTADGYDFDSCFDWIDEYEADISLACRDNTSDVSFDVFFFSDQASVRAGILDDWKDFEEVPWERGTDYVEDGGKYYYSVVRCYADAPACISVFEDTREEAEAALSQILYLDAAGVASLNAKLQEAGLTGQGT